MFFVLSKVLGFFAVPSNLLMVTGLLGASLLFTRFVRAGRVLVIVTVLMLLIGGLSPLGNALILTLEDRFPPWDDSGEAPAGIIVLGGAITPDVSAARLQPALNEAAERITSVAELARRFPNARIVFTGGTGRLLGGFSEADFAGQLFDSFGISPERVALEGRSRNTVENARFTKELVQPKTGEHWLLVTSAFHMPRSMGVFQREGFAVEAYPVDWRTRGSRDVVMLFGDVASGLARTDTAVHEWAGLIAYWLTGQTSELFPGPSPRPRRTP